MAYYKWYNVLTAAVAAGLMSAYSVGCGPDNEECKRETPQYCEASDDPDKDGLSYGREEELGTNNFAYDTDGDGLGDGDEADVYGTNPVASDGDGDELNDKKEVEVGTDPNNADSDNDGLNDGEEVNIYHTNPNSNDSDGDGLTDFREVRDYSTNPLASDTDGDGMDDKWEVEYGLNPTDSSDAELDRDGDGLSNLEERVLGTNPLVSDTDGDGFSDKEERDGGSDPLDPESKPNIPPVADAGPDITIYCEWGVHWGEYVCYGEHLWVFSQIHGQEIACEEPDCTRTNSYDPDGEIVKYCVFTAGMSSFVCIFPWSMPFGYYSCMEPGTYLLTLKVIDDRGTESLDTALVTKEEVN